MCGVEFYAAVRLAVVDEGLSHHEAARRFGIGRRTVKKMLSYSSPPEEAGTAAEAGGFTGIIDAILEADRDEPRKQRHTAQGDLRAPARRARFHRRLHDSEGRCPCTTAVDARGLRAAAPPARPCPGRLRRSRGRGPGRREQVAFSCLILPHSNVWFVKAYPRETTEAFVDGHVSAFAFLGGLPRSILYDNTTLAVARVLGDGTPPPPTRLRFAYRKALHEAARSPPVDYRDNLHRATHGVNFARR